MSSFARRRGQQHNSDQGSRPRTPQLFCLMLVTLFVTTSCSPSNTSETRLPSIHLTGRDAGVLAWHPGGDHIAVKNYINTRLCQWTVSQGTRDWCISTVGTVGERSLSFSPSGNEIVTRPILGIGPDNREQSVSILDSRTGQELRTLSAKSPTTGANVSAGFTVSDRGNLAVILGTDTGLVAVYNTISWQLMTYIGPITNTHGSHSGAEFVSVDERRNLVAIGLADSEIQI